MSKPKRSKKEVLVPQIPLSWRISILCALSLILFVATALAPIPQVAPRSKNFNVSAAEMPVGNNQQAPSVSAQAAIIYDPVSSVTLFEQNADTKVSPVSTTKMVTGILAINSMPKSMIVEVPKIKVDPQIMKLVAGEKITMQDLLYGLLVWSANDAAEVIAQAYPGGRDKFIFEMNNLAQQIGMNSTHFVNPSGIPEPNHYSTARDLARFAAMAMRNPDFSEIVQTKEITVSSVDGKIKHKLVNLNELLGSVKGVLGVKTGWSEESGGALVTYVKRDDHPLVFVVLGSADRFADSKSLIEWAYKNYRWQGVDSYLP